MRPKDAIYLTAPADTWATYDEAVAYRPISAMYRKMFHNIGSYYNLSKNKSETIFKEAIMAVKVDIGRDGWRTLTVQDFKSLIFAKGKVMMAEEGWRKEMKARLKRNKN